MRGGGRNPNNPGGNGQQNAKPALFKAFELEDDQVSLLGGGGSSQGRGLARPGMQFLDLMFAMYVLSQQLVPSQFGQLNLPGQAGMILTFILCILAGGALIGRRSRLEMAWNSFRAIFFTLAMIVSFGYLGAVRTSGESLEFGHFIPMLFSLINLGMSGYIFGTGSSNTLQIESNPYAQHFDKNDRDQA